MHLLWSEAVSSGKQRLGYRMKRCYPEKERSDQCAYVLKQLSAFLAHLVHRYMRMFLEACVPPNTCRISHGERTCSLELLDDRSLNQVVPSVHLPVTIGLANFGLELILVACDDELLSIVSIVIWGVHDEDEL